jgi:hypothetical protein
MVTRVHVIMALAFLHHLIYLRQHPPPQSRPSGLLVFRYLSYHLPSFKLAFNIWFNDWVNRDDESFRPFLFVPRLLADVFELAV